MKNTLRKPPQSELLVFGDLVLHINKKNVIEKIHPGFCEKNK